MSNLPPDSDDLQQRITALLRPQPDRRAPASLQRRVLAAIRERRTAPWWQRGFATWPMAARLAFLLVSVGLAVLVLTGAPSLTGLLQPATGPLPAAARLASTAADTAALVLHGIPTSWLTGLVALAGLLYLATFAIGATAYRTLYTRS